MIARVFKGKAKPLVKVCPCGGFAPESLNDCITDEFPLRLKTVGLNLWNQTSWCLLYLVLS